MWTISSRGDSVVVADDSSLSSLSSSSLFSKDGRLISVGDCALFKPPKECPPFIGIIRSLSFGKDNIPKLRVNWLYRPFEAKLGNGILLEAAPNEIFYSFHKDEIPAASLIHPCKVAFLPKGVELPSGISSFVCRRVYDITNKCLWWLNDKDFINERQEEVDKLLFKTQIEMHAMVQSGVQPPKPTLVSLSTSQLKVGSDSVQNCSPTVPLQAKGRKRERVERGSEFARQDCVARRSDENCANDKLESILKSEIFKTTKNGGLADAEGVEKMVQLMLSDGSGKKIDLAARTMLAGVIEATDKLECLSLFVQYRGLPVFDEWLQEVHKGKMGDSSSLKDTDRSVEEFLLILLRALDKLPVNLPALQMCNIGKSVNHLRTHKNFEIQKKARSLVDTWKKRVAAEMNINDAKSGSNQVVSWSSRQHLPEVPHGGNRHSGEISDVAVKSLATQQTTAKTTSVKPVHGERISPFACTSPSFKKTFTSCPSATTQLKDGQQRLSDVGDATELSGTIARDDRSSSSSQSHKTDQSYSSEHSKSRGLAKEDARSSAAGSLCLNKIYSVSSHPQKSINEYPASISNVVPKEFWPGRRSLLPQNSAAERFSQSGLTCEKAPDFTVSEGSQKLRIKIPNQDQSPAQCTSGGSFEDHSVLTSRASSPMLLENHHHFDCHSKEKIDSEEVHVISDVIAESWQSNDIKDVAIASVDGDGSPVSVHDEGNSRTCNDSIVVKAYPPSLAGDTGSFPEASFSILNALIESCVKHSEADPSTFVDDDDVGMKLLASVATGEMSQEDVVLTLDSPQRIVVVDDCSHLGADLKEEPSPGETSRDHIQSNYGVDEGRVINFRPDSGEGKPLQSENVPAGKHLVSLHNKSEVKVVASPKSTIKMSDDVADSPTSMLETGTDGQGVKTLLKNSINDVDRNNLLECTPLSSSRLSSGIHVNNVVLGQEVEMQAINVCTEAHKLMEGDNENHNYMHESANDVIIAEKASKIIHFESVEVKNDAASVKDFILETANEIMIENDDRTSSRTLLQPERQIDGAKTTVSEYPVSVAMGTDATNQHNEFVEERLGSEDVRGRNSEQVNHEMLSESRSEERERCVGLEESRLPGTESDKTSFSSVSAAGVSDINVKLEFDLNECFDVDDGKCGESNIWMEPECSTGVKLISPLPVPGSFVSNCLPASITVTVAAKGSFVPQDDLLRNKREIGWKGSAVTSAFRPAGPRKILGMPPCNNTSVSSADAAATINSRPWLDIDLNVPDERILEDINSSVVCHSIVNHDLASASVCRSGGIDLDLNQVDETVDVSNYSTSNVSGKDVSLPVDKSCSISNDGGPKFERDFDLNGPMVEEVSVAPSLFYQQGRCNIPSQPSPPGPCMNNLEMGNFPTWFPPGNTYSTVTIPSLMSDRSEQLFPNASGGHARMLSPTFTNNSFSPDLCRGSTLSSSPAVPFPPVPFQYHFFPFGSSFPFPSGSFSSGSTSYVDSSASGRFCFSAVPPQLFGPAGTVSSHYPRPYVVSLPNGNFGSGENNQKWGKQCLDLNAGPRGLDTERRDETLFFGQKQQSAASSHVQGEDHMGIYQPAHGIFKRKEPEFGWDGCQRSSR